MKKDDVGWGLGKGCRWWFCCCRVYFTSVCGKEEGRVKCELVTRAATKKKKKKKLFAS